MPGLGCTVTKVGFFALAFLGGAAISMGRRGSSKRIAPLRKARARPENRTFVDVTPKPGTLLLWESWLRHGVEPNGARGKRISVSFNYRTS